MMLKAIEIGKPASMFEFFKFHAELLYHPHPNVTNQYFDSCKTAGYEQVKLFFAVIKGRYMLNRPADLHERIIELAF